MTKFSDKDLKSFYNNVNDASEDNINLDFSKRKNFITRDLDFNQLNKYSPKQLIKGARTVEELYKIGEYLKQREGKYHSWWQYFRERKVQLAKQPSLYGVNPVTGKTEWGVPLNPESYASPRSKQGIESINRRLHSQFASWEQIIGQNKLIELQDTNKGPVLKNWQSISRPKIKSNTSLNALIFDLETTGLVGEKNSSIISLGMWDVAKSPKPEGFYADFNKALKYPSYIKNKIIPQWESAVLHGNEKLITERQLVETFIQKIEASAGTHALMGYNIKEFDIPKLYESAQKYGLQGKLSSAFEKIDVVDVSDLAKSFLSEKIGSSVSGWQKSQLGVNPLGWQLEVVAEALGYKATKGAAHEAKADVAMTQYVWEQLKDTSKWESKKIDVDELLNLIKSHKGISPTRITKKLAKLNFASQMLPEENLYKIPLHEKLAKDFPDVTETAIKSIVKKNALPGEIKSINYAAKSNLVPGASGKLLLGLAAIGTIGATYSLLSNNAPSKSAGPLSPSLPSEDAYVNKFADNYSRQQSTTYKQNRPIPSHIAGVPIDPRILAFRRDVIDQPDKLKELEDELAKKEAASGSLITDFSPADLKPVTPSSIPGTLNTDNTGLKEVNLKDFEVKIEDADTVILRRRTENILKKEKPIIIRLAGIDAPEISSHMLPDPTEFIRIAQEQLQGKQATDKLRRRIENQSNLRLIIDTKNKTYGRSIGVFLGPDNVNINVQAAREGLVSALPFGSEESDIIPRDIVAKAEEEAVADERGIWKFARYKAIREATKEIGGPITYNTLTQLTKLGRNLNLGAYQSFLEQMGSRTGDLTPQELQTARILGSRLERAYNPSRFANNRKKQDKKEKNRWFNAIGEMDSNYSESGHYKKTATPRHPDFSYSKTIGSDDFLQSEGLGHKGIAWQLRQSLTDFGSGSRVAQEMEKTLAPGIFKKIGNFFSRRKPTTLSEGIRSLAKESNVKIFNDPSEFAKALWTNEKQISAVEERAKRAIALSVSRKEGKYIYSGSVERHKEWLKETKVVPSDISEEELTRKAYKSKMGSELHEVLEIKHTENFGDSNVTDYLYGKGGHSTLKVIKDEEYLLRKIDPEAYSIFKKFRTKEAENILGVGKSISNEELLPQIKKLKELAFKARAAKKAGNKELQEKFSQEYDELLGPYERKRYGQQLQKIYKKDGIHPGVDDSVSTRQIRSHSDFGTGWDSVRTIAKAMFKDLSEEDAFIALRNSDLFKNAIKAGMQKGGKRLGQGAFGKVTEYAGVIKHGMADIPEEFSFVVKEMKKDARFNSHLRSIWKGLPQSVRKDMVKNKSSWKVFRESERRKYGEIAEAFENSSIQQEVNSIEKLGSSTAPSLYGHGKNYDLGDRSIIMEKIKGESLKDRAGLSIAESRQLWNDVKNMHSTGRFHMDLHEGNIMRAKLDNAKQQFAFIDFGLANRLEDTWLNKGAWRTKEKIIQQHAKDIIGKEITVKEFQQRVDQSRVYGYLLEGQGQKEAGNEIHTSFSKFLAADSKEHIDDSVRTILQASKEAERYFSDISTNMQISTNVKIKKAVNSSTKTAAEDILAKEQDKKSSRILLEKTPNMKFVQNKTFNGKLRARKRFQELSRESVGAGARMSHNAGRRHSRFNSTRSS